MAVGSSIRHMRRFKLSELCLDTCTLHQRGYTFILTITALHNARFYNSSGDGERKRLPTENLIAPAAPSLTSATFRSYLFPSIFYLFLFPSAHSYFCLPSPPLSKSLSISSASEFTTKARLLALLPLFCHPAPLPLLCLLFFS